MLPLGVHVHNAGAGRAGTQGPCQLGCPAMVSSPWTAQWRMAPRAFMSCVRAAGSTCTCVHPRHDCNCVSQASPRTTGGRHSVWTTPASRGVPSTSCVHDWLCALHGNAAKLCPGSWAPAPPCMHGCFRTVLQVAGTCLGSSGRRLPPPTSQPPPSALYTHTHARAACSCRVPGPPGGRAELVCAAVGD